jgi:mono/diheme cytochrome c family protein
MKKRLVLRLLFLSSIFVLAFVAVTVYPDSGNRSAEQSKQSGNQDWKAPASADTLKNPFAHNSEATKKGKNLFNTYCTNCHGENGMGNGPLAESLTPKPHDLTSKPVKEESDGAIFWKITTGKPPMIAWQNTLSEKQRWQLVNYIRQLEKK